MIQINDKDNLITVSELNIQLKDHIKKVYSTKISVIGEISGYKKYGTTIYANLKDDNAAINIIKFKANDDNFNNGDLVCATGNIDYYVKNGNINFVCTKLENVGIGDIKKDLDNLKQKYEKMGYFNNKKSFPKNINSIGIITAKDGAALQDILFVLNSNKFNGNIYIKNSPVQGTECPKGICAGIDFFNKFKHNNKEIDLIMITRGGGGIDDLIGFSHASVIEAIYNSNIFVMSAVGHEVDNMLSDFVADIRAPTPSIGAEMICKNVINNESIINNYKNNTNIINNNIRNKINYTKSNFYSIKKKMYMIIYEKNNKLIDNLDNKFNEIIINKFKNLKHDIDKIKSNIDIVKHNEYNALLINSINKKQIKSINELINGKYKIKINGEIKEITIII
jgi:exodeoxyribonuclease VII large subunit